MKYADFLNQSAFSQQEILAFSTSKLIEDAPEGLDVQLPIPPMLMIDRITEISKTGNKGHIRAEQDVNLSDWFFSCHFKDDPVQPGCLGLDGVWQLLGFYCAWAGGLGAGRALAVGEVEFSGQIRPHDELVTYEIDVRRFQLLPQSGSAVVIGDATLPVDGEAIYSIKKAKVGLFRGIQYPDFPNLSENARGGRIER